MRMSEKEYAKAANKPWSRALSSKTIADIRIERKADQIVQQSKKHHPEEVVAPPALNESVHGRRAKYGNVKEDGCDSKREAKRLRELRMLNASGHIRGLARQVEYVLIPTQRDRDGKLQEKLVKYVADFAFFERNGDEWRYVVCDAKGYATPEWVHKRKLMLSCHGIEVREI